MTNPLSFESNIFVAGHRGMVGAAIVRQLQRLGYQNIITRTHSELELTDQQAVRGFFRRQKIDHVVLAAAKVGGIHANNTYPASFIYQNIMIQTNVIHEAYAAGVEQLLFLGSSCIYPKFSPQPIREEDLLTGVLEPTNEPYAVAKIAGIKMCESYNRQYGTGYYSVMPTNLYGPGDNYHLQNSHVIPAMIRKYHLAKLALQGDIAAIQRDEAVFGIIPADIREAIGYQSLAPISKPPHVLLWGSGTARREFLHVDDMARACVFLMTLGKDPFCRPGVDSLQPCSFVNIGTGKDITIRDVAKIICEVVGFTGDTIFNPNQPDGTPQKLLDTQRINNLGWSPEYSLRDGLTHAYQWYCGQSITNEPF
jgi:GDP-L-fucose synthase